MSVNKVMLIGRLGKDPEVRQTGNGVSIADISLATTERRKKGESWENHTEWHRLTAFGKTADLCAQYLSKGSQAYFEGRLQTDKWEKDGQTRYTTKILVDKLAFLDSKKESSGDTPIYKQVDLNQDTAQSQNSDYDFDEDSIPF